MQVVSGPIGREKVHYEAPGYDGLDREMTAFIKWFNAKPNMDWVLSAAIAHFWFVTIHPFDDGFEGRLTSSKWAKMVKCSGDTALRDITDLLDRGILIKDRAGRRSTGYLLKLQSYNPPLMPLRPGRKQTHQ